MSKIAHSSIGIVNVDDGAKGEQGYSVTGTFPEYYLSSSSTALVDGTWSETKPTATENKYIWTRLKTVLSNGTIKYSNYTCDTTLSGVISKVNQTEQKITNKVWQTDISASIDSYDNSKGKSIRDRVSKVETDLTGITSTVSDVKTTLNSKANTSDVNTHVTNLTSKIQQNADKIGLMVSVDGTSSSLTLTDKMLEAVTEQFVVKSPNGVSTVIEGGKIKTDAIKSTNYQSGSVYSKSGSFFDLSNGNITTPEFAVSSGQASFKGTLTATKGTIGRWKIGTDTLTATDGKNQVGLGDSSRAFWAGSATSSSAPFQVLYDGTVIATKLKIGDTAVADYVNNAADYANQKSLSRGNNLVTNGNGILGNNYNFPGFEYDGSESYNGSAGSFKYGGEYVMFRSREKIPISTNKHYKISYAHRSTAPIYNKCVIDCYDIDGNEIIATDVIFVASSLTYLTQDLNNGDSVIHLGSTDGFNTQLKNLTGLIFWNYKNSYGYQYPEETYSRNHWNNLWSDESSFSGNDITLSSPWTHGNFAAGTKVSQIGNGDWYMYADAHHLTNEWTEETVNIDDINSGNNTCGVGIYGFRPGTAFIKIAFLVNIERVENYEYWLTNVRLEEIDDTAIEAKDNAKTANDNAAKAQKTADDATKVANTAQTDIKNINTTVGETTTAIGDLQTNMESVNTIASNASQSAQHANDTITMVQKDITSVDVKLNSLIRTTSDGVECGEVPDIATLPLGQSVTVPTALVNTHGSFDVVLSTFTNTDGTLSLTQSNTVASFGGTKAFIGDTNQIHAEIDRDSFDIVDGNKNVYAKLGGSTPLVQIGDFTFVNRKNGNLTLRLNN